MRHGTMLLIASLLLGGCTASRVTSADEGQQIADPAEVERIAGAVESAGELNAVEPGAEGSQPSIQGFYRSNWPTLVVHPADGTVHHYPAYLADRSHRTIHDLDLHEVTEEERVQFALGPASEGSIWLEALTAPLHSLIQIATLPVSVATQSPFSTTVSPTRTTGPATAGSVQSRTGPQQGGDRSPGTAGGRGAGPGFGSGAGGAGGGGGVGGTGAGGAGGGR